MITHWIKRDQQIGLYSRSPESDKEVQRMDMNFAQLRYEQCIQRAKDRSPYIGLTDKETFEPVEDQTGEVD